MRPWMIPWLFPAGIVVLVLVLALLPGWAALPVLAAIVVCAAPMIWRAWAREHPDRQLPDWLPGGRPPR